MINYKQMVKNSKIVWEENMNNEILIRFEEGSEAVPFLKVGVFSSSNGKNVEITEDILDKIVENFKSGAAEQEVPIDIKHQFAEAAGWVKDVYRKGTILYAKIDWNDMGADLVSRKIYKYLSASIDLTNRILKAISLVNFPAVKGFDPISLQENNENKDKETILFIESNSLESRIRFISDKFYSFLNRENLEEEYNYRIYIKEIFDTYIIINIFENDSDVFYKVTYTEEGENVVFQPRESWIKVIRDYVPVGTEQLSQNKGDNISMDENKEKEVLGLKEGNLDEGGDGTNLETNENSTVTVTEGDSENKEFLTKLSAQLREQIQSIIQEQVEEVRIAVKEQIQAELEENVEITTFAERVTSTGTNALPVSPQKVQNALKGLDKAKRTEIMALLEAVYDNGTVTFEEVGTSQGKQEKDLPKDYDEIRKAVALFEQGGESVESFFNVMPNLNKEDYGY